jgi:hypothetical protein
VFVLGNPAPPCTDRGCTDSCSTEGKAHWHNILRGSAKPPASTGESILLEIYRERITTYMEEEDHFTQTQLPALLLHLQLLQWQQGYCHCNSLFLSTLTFSLSALSLSLLSNNCLFYRQTWWAFSSNSKGTIGPEIMPLIVALVVLPLSHN